MNSVLGNHSQILGLQELHFIGRRWRPGENKLWSSRKAVRESALLVATARRSIWDAGPTNSDIAYARKALARIDAGKIDPALVYNRILDCLLREAEKTFVIDQTPRNIFYAEALLERFPSSHVIQMIRDPRAVLLSQKNRWRQRRLGAANIPIWNAIRVFINYHPITMSRLWLKAYEAADRVDGHPRFARIRFEEFVSEPRASTMRICEWIRLDYEEKMLDVPNIGSSNVPHNPSKFGISIDVTDRWRVGLSKADTWICQRILGSVLEEAGYKTVNTGVPVLGIAWRLLVYPIHLVGAVMANPLLALHTLRSAANAGKKIR